MDNITVVIITYKSEKKVFDLINKIPKNIKIIVIENSENHKLKEKIKNEYKNAKVYVIENNGVSTSLNFAAKKIETKYFLQISPDIDFDFGDLKIYYELANEINNKFAAIGPRFVDVKEKSHKQIKKNIKHDKIDSIHGSCMFINKKCFDEIGGFDNNFFLYFEETEYCYRGKKKGYYSYQVNNSIVKSLGRSVETKNSEEDQNLSNILIWHFIWSKFYFNKKKYGKTLTIIKFIPLIIRIIFKILIYKFLRKKENLTKYKFRLDGLVKSILNKKSDLRP